MGFEIFGILFVAIWCWNVFHSIVLIRLYVKLKKLCKLDGLPYMPHAENVALAWDCAPRKIPNGENKNQFLVYSDKYDEYPEIKKIKEEIRLSYRNAIFGMKMTYWIPALFFAAIGIEITEWLLGHR